MNAARVARRLRAKYGHRAGARLTTRTRYLWFWRTVARNLLRDYLT